MEQRCRPETLPKPPHRCRPARALQQRSLCLSTSPQWLNGYCAAQEQHSARSAANTAAFPARPPIQAVGRRLRRQLAHERPCPRRRRTFWKYMLFGNGKRSVAEERVDQFCFKKNATIECLALKGGGKKREGEGAR